MKQTKLLLTMLIGLVTMSCSNNNKQNQNTDQTQSIENVESSGTTDESADEMDNGTINDKNDNSSTSRQEFKKSLAFLKLEIEHANKELPIRTSWGSVDNEELVGNDIVVKITVDEARGYDIQEVLEERAKALLNGLYTANTEKKNVDKDAMINNNVSFKIIARSSETGEKFTKTISPEELRDALEW